MITRIYKIILLTIILFFMFLLVPVSAHQPHIVDSLVIQVLNPEISKAYYGELKGEPHVYIIEASKPFDLYVNVLLPDIKGQKKDVSALILKDGLEITKLDGINFEWKKIYEPFGADTYWVGPEYKVRAGVGTYKIYISSINNDSKYSLAIGEVEAFNIKESLNALNTIPKLKKNFFNESSISFIRSPFGWGLIVIMYFLAFIFGFVCRMILKKVVRNSPRGVSKNIGKSDRLLRLIIGIGLLLYAITTTWSPILIFFSGFALFEAIFSWCGFYAAMGKNTCPYK